MILSIYGSTGKLGQEIQDAFKKDQKFSQWSLLTGLPTEHSLSHQRNHSAPPPISNERIFFIDVSSPAGSITLSRSIQALPTALKNEIGGVVIGTTGHTPTEKEIIRENLKSLPLVFCPNFSKGLVLLRALLESKIVGTHQTFSQFATSLGFDLGLWEAHHNQKKDHPSGTGKLLAQLLQLPDEKIASSRVGKIVGEHSILSSAEGEEVRISHVAHERKVFAQGALDLIFKMQGSSLEHKEYTADDIFKIAAN